MICPDCGAEAQRPHWHGDEDHSLALRYGRFKAEQERDWIRELVARSHAEVDREIDLENRAIRSLEE